MCYHIDVREFPFPFALTDAAVFVDFPRCGPLSFISFHGGGPSNFLGKKKSPLTSNAGGFFLLVRRIMCLL
jgi:hypothetical protein